MSKSELRKAITAVAFSLLIAGCCVFTAEVIAQTSVQGTQARPAPDVGEAATQFGRALGTMFMLMFVAFIVLAVAVRVVFVFWSRGKPYARIAYAGCALSVVVVTLIIVGPRACRIFRERDPGLAAPAEAPSAPPPTSARAPRGTPQDQLQVFTGKGCKLSAPLTWKVQTDPGNTDAKLVIANPTGDASVGIHFEPATGTKLTKRDIARLMEGAKRMPLALEDSNWSLIDNHDAWREVRAGTLRGSSRLWIRYSYQLDKAVVQVIGVASGRRSRGARELLESIIMSTHCEP